MEPDNSELPGIYIHVPFCRTKCPYCDFYSCTDLKPAEGFIKALEKELLFYATSFPAADTLYVGGGTPTVLPDTVLAEILGMVRRQCLISSGAEITIEANPNDLSPGRLAGLRSLGFNRLSLGVQSFDDGVLRFLGRRHTAAEARQALAGARQAGFENISLDFIYAVPGQKQQAWLSNLEEALRYCPEHLSCYQLTIKEQTPFFARMQQGALQPCDEREQAGLFLATSGFLEERGYSHYEVSSFCRCESLQARHNRKYWEHVPYLGLGPSAHSFDGSRRWWNVQSVKGYVQALAASGIPGSEKQSGRACGENGRLQAMPVAQAEQLTAGQLRSEALMLGLRTRKGAAVDAAGMTAAPQLLDRLQAEGLITVAHGRVSPTTRGMLLADSLAALL